MISWIINFAERLYYLRIAVKMAMRWFTLGIIAGFALGAGFILINMGGKG